jgi:hypothetical protein
LASFVLRHTEKVHEVVAMLFALFDPGSRDRRELCGAIDLFDVDEPGIVEQVAVGSVGGDADGAIAVGAPALGWAQAGCGVDGEERRAPSGTEEDSRRSQHGELRS